MKQRLQRQRDWQGEHALVTFGDEFCVVVGLPKPFRRAKKTGSVVGTRTMAGKRALRRLSCGTTAAYDNAVNFDSYFSMCLNASAG